MTLGFDRRSLRDSDQHHITPTSFFAEEFPRLAAAHGHLVAAGYQALAPPPLTVEVEGTAWTLNCEDDRIEVKAGAMGEAVTVILSTPQFSDWAQNQITLNGLLVAGALEFRCGTHADISVWDSLWISLLVGWPVVNDQLIFRDRKGAPLDLRASFTPDGDPDDITHFLREAGYLHLRGWLNPSDMAEIAADMERALPFYFEGDGKSWWAGLSDGSRTCVRLQEFVQHSPVSARLLASDTWQRLRHILSREVKLAPEVVEGRIIEALFKPVGVISGPSDLSFHRDCHLGRHAYECSRMTVGIPLTPSNEENGLLRVIAGSHRLAMPVETAITQPYLPVIPLPTEPGDLTVHLSCTLHDATPPVLSERRVMYTELSLAPFAGEAPIHTEVGDIREQVSDLLRDKRNDS